MMCNPPQSPLDITVQEYIVLQHYQLGMLIPRRQISLVWNEIPGTQLKLELTMQDDLIPSDVCRRSAARQWLGTSVAAGQLGSG